MRVASLKGMSLSEKTKTPGTFVYKDHAFMDGDDACTLRVLQDVLPLEMESVSPGFMEPEEIDHT